MRADIALPAPLAPVRAGQPGIRAIASGWRSDGRPGKALRAGDDFAGSARFCMEEDMPAG